MYMYLYTIPCWWFSIRWLELQTLDSGLWTLNSEEQWIEKSDPHSWSLSFETEPNMLHMLRLRQ
jgi:hypothetical protein